MTPLQLAYASMCMKSFRYLWEHALAHSSSCAHTAGLKLLYKACCEGLWPVVEILLGTILVNANLTKGKSALSVACEYGHLELAGKLIGNKDTDVNHKDDDGNTPLHVASSKGYETIVSLLLDHKAKVD